MNETQIEILIADIETRQTVDGSDRAAFGAIFADLTDQEATRRIGMVRARKPFVNPDDLIGGDDWEPPSDDKEASAAARLFVARYFGGSPAAIQSLYTALLTHPSPSAQAVGTVIRRAYISARAHRHTRVDSFDPWRHTATLEVQAALRTIQQTTMTKPDVIISRVNRLLPTADPNNITAGIELAPAVIETINGIGQPKLLTGPDAEAPELTAALGLPELGTGADGERTATQSLAAIRSMSVGERHRVLDEVFGERAGVRRERRRVGAGPVVRRSGAGGAQRAALAAMRQEILDSGGEGG